MAKNSNPATPKVFISYSWSSLAHKEFVRGIAERLISDGVDVILDEWDLREGDDLTAFMEQMVSDESVTHVLVISDGEYASKADSRQAGVGTESQIISSKVYSATKQSKFIPIVCEHIDGEPCLPVYMQSRIWVDFSSPELVNENWEKLIRLLYGKPLHVKPAKGAVPNYITSTDSGPISESKFKLDYLKSAVYQQRVTQSSLRKEFLKSCFIEADKLRVRVQPSPEGFENSVLADCRKLKVLRDLIVEWVLMEAPVSDSGFTNELLGWIERMLTLKSRPVELSYSQDHWFDAEAQFVYETFLYIVAVLIACERFDILRKVLTHQYMRPSGSMNDDPSFVDFRALYAYCKTLQILSEKRNLLCPSAEYIKIHADHAEITFQDIIQADLIVFLVAAISDDIWWRPQTFYYATQSSPFPLFAKATRSSDFKSLTVLTGIETGDRLRALLVKGFERLGVSRWEDTWGAEERLSRLMNIGRLDTLRID